ncbi:hypothetical protein PHMEG_00035252 [Phytophthora megakarya]|uniref:DDE Tnp4 domain-containing protein n=1 Tax=Phytophthora megakarya TaxID=4795 RepID=A0A225UP51_9STRA|nr:hypothetical protein PHMEG_00035252 [Phytophthora megakarya]
MEEDSGAQDYELQARNGGENDQATEVDTATAETSYHGYATQAHDIDSFAADEGVVEEEQVVALAEEEILALCLIVILLSVVLGQLDGRSIRGPIQEKVVVRTNFFATLKAQRSRTAHKKTLRCSPDSFNALYQFDLGLAALLTYYGNGCGINGDGIGGAAAQIGMSRTIAGVSIKRLEDLLFDMIPDVIYVPPPNAVEEWEGLVEGFVQRGSDFPDVACGFYDKSGNPSYNCLAAIDFLGKFRYVGVFSGSNSDQPMWNQSDVLGPRARYLCPPGINWLADAEV